MNAKALKTVLFLLYLFLAGVHWAYAKKICPRCHRTFADSVIYCPYETVKTRLVKFVPSPSPAELARRHAKERAAKERLARARRAKILAQKPLPTKVATRRFSGNVPPPAPLSGRPPKTATGSLADLKVISNDLVWVRRYEEASTGPNSMEANTAKSLLRKVEPRLRAIARKYPQNATVHRLLGQVYYYEDRILPAEKEFNTALQLALRDADSMDGLGRVYLRQNRPDAAEPLFREATTLRENSYFFWTDLATALSARGRYDEANQAVQKAKQYGASEIVVNRIKVTR